MVRSKVCHFVGGLHPVYHRHLDKCAVCTLELLEFQIDNALVLDQGSRFVPFVHVLWLLVHAQGGLPSQRPRVSIALTETKPLLMKINRAFQVFLSARALAGIEFFV